MYAFLSRDIPAIFLKLLAEHRQNVNIVLVFKIDFKFGNNRIVQSELLCKMGIKSLPSNND